MAKIKQILKSVISFTVFSATPFPHIKLSPLAITKSILHFFYKQTFGAKLSADLHPF